MSASPDSAITGPASPAATEISSRPAVCPVPERTGACTERPTFAAEDLEDYDQGLRRYPVVFYFHTRRVERSIPRIFAVLGDLIELIRWGLPPDQPLTASPYLLVLADEYTTAP